MLVRSPAALKVAIKRVTQTNKGKRTPGVDRYLALSDAERGKLFIKIINRNRAGSSSALFDCVPWRFWRHPESALDATAMKERMQKIMDEKVIDPETSIVRYSQADLGSCFRNAHTINTGNGLNKRMLLNWLVYINRIKFRYVKTGKPHIDYNGNLEIGLRILELAVKLFSIFFCPQHIKPIIPVPIFPFTPGAKTIFT